MLCELKFILCVLIVNYVVRRPMPFSGQNLCVVHPNFFKLEIEVIANYVKGNTFQLSHIMTLRTEINFHFNCVLMYRVRSLHCL
jgi:hypothetical protein